MEKIVSKKVFMKGVLWMDTVTPHLLVSQGRFESLKLFLLSIEQQADGEGAVDLVEKADFMISHEGFCKGFLQKQTSDSCLIFTPSSSASIIVSKLRDNFLRPVVTLNPERTNPELQTGTIMSAAYHSDDLLLAAYENSDIFLWNWKSNTVVYRINIPVCGTLMSLVYDKERNYAVAAGSDKSLVVLDCSEKSSIKILKEGNITNGGVGMLGIRPDKLLLVAGGWDSRIRLFSWKHPDRLKPLAVLEFHSQAVECLSFTERQILSGRTRKNLFAAGGKDGKISLWGIY